MKRSPWPLIIIAAPAAVAIWSGWVGIGQLAGFGVVQPLPGILPWYLDTAITLPVGIEAYGAYALGAWLSPGSAPEAARTFARRSAIGALLLGMTGQVVFHLLAAAHATRAPWPVVVLVSCVPVVTLGFAAALTHLLRQPESAPGEHPALVTAPVLEPWSAPLASRRQNGNGKHPEGAPELVPAASGNGHREHPPRAVKSAATGREQPPASTASPLAEFEPELASGVLPSIREIRRRVHVGEDKAKGILRDLEREQAHRRARTP